MPEGSKKSMEAGIFGRFDEVEELEMSAFDQLFIFYDGKAFTWAEKTMFSLALRQQCQRTDLDLHGSGLLVKVNFFSSALWRPAISVFSASKRLCF